MKCSSFIYVGAAIAVAISLCIAIRNHGVVLLGESHFPGHEEFQLLPSEGGLEVGVVCVGNLDSSSDETLRAISRLVYLQELSINTDFRDHHAWMFRRLNGLRFLDINSPNFDGALREVGTHCRALEELHCTHTSVSDEVVSVVDNLPLLRVLTLGSLGITDASLPFLSTLKQLEFLDVSRTSLSNEAVEQLTVALPHTRIVGP